MDVHEYSPGSLHQQNSCRRIRGRRLSTYWRIYCASEARWTNHESAARDKVHQAELLLLSRRLSMLIYKTERRSVPNK